MNKKYSILASVLLGTTALSLPMAGLAQEADDGLFTLEEITVTATRRATSVQDVPYNITAISGAALARAGVNDITDLMRAVPGIPYLDQGPRFSRNNYIILRGLNANSTSGASDLPQNAQSPVSTYLGETPLFTNLRMTDVDRVEVLRGPQGTLFGSGSLGGTIRIIPNKPDPSEFEAVVHGDFSKTKDSGDIGFDLNGVVNVPISDTMALRVSGGYRETAGFIDLVGRMQMDDSGDTMPVASIDPVWAKFTGDMEVVHLGNPVLLDPSNIGGSAFATMDRLEDSNGSKDYHIRAALLAELSDTAEVTLTYHYQKAEVDGRQAASLHIEEDNVLNSYFEEPMDSETHLISLDIEVDMGFATLSSATSYTDQDAKWIRDASGSYAVVWAAFYDYYPRVSGYSKDHATDETFVQEVRLASNSDGNIDWIVGGYYQKTDKTHIYFMPIPGLSQWADATDYYTGSPEAIATRSVFYYVWAPLQFGDLSWTADRSVAFKDKAIFGEVTYHVSDEWQVTGGMRAFWQDFEQPYVQTQVVYGVWASQDGVDPHGLTDVFVEDHTSDQIFKLNTSYDINEDTKVYFTWAEGFRHGGGNSFPLIGPQAVSAEFLFYGADKATNWEVGIKGTANGNLQYTVAGFFIDWTDPQFDGFVGAGYPVVLNAEAAESKGLEVELKGGFSENMPFTFGYTYTDATWSKDSVIAGGILNKGDTVPGVPKHMLTASMDYIQLMDNDMEFVAHADMFYRSSTRNTPNETWGDESALGAGMNFHEYSGYAIINASLTLSKDAWSVTAYAKNLTDSTGSSGGQRARGPLSFDFVGRPRTFGLKASHRF